MQQTFLVVARFLRGPPNPHLVPHTELVFSQTTGIPDGSVGVGDWVALLARNAIHLQEVTENATEVGLSVDRAHEPLGLPRDDAEAAYREAIELDPENARWNHRLVTFLIAQGRLRSARRAWREAIDRVDPDGERMSVWLAEQFHHWVCQAWLEAGSPSDAFEVLNSVPGDVIPASERMTSIRQRVLDAIEAEALGGSVYPALCPIANRWHRPEALTDDLEGKPLKEWFPGRVLKADGDVQIFYGKKIGDEYRSMLARVERSAWTRMSKMPAPQEGDFVFLGVYKGDARVVVAQAKPESLKSEPVLPLAYFNRWRSGE